MFTHEEKLQVEVTEFHFSQHFLIRYSTRNPRTQESVDHFDQDQILKHVHTIADSKEINLQQE
jgi:hypothetical protein